MIRDFRIENHLFYPHLRNGSYSNFFEQSTDKTVETSNTSLSAISLWHIDIARVSRPILQLEAEVSKVLAEMEVYGVYLERSILDNLEQELTKTLQEIESKVAAQTGDTVVNLASPLQLQKLLFETM